MIGRQEAELPEVRQVPLYKLTKISLQHLDSPPALIEQLLQHVTKEEDTAGGRSPHWL